MGLIEEVPEVPNLRRHRFGWCMEGRHLACPAVIPEMRWPDPSRKGTFYTIPESRCPCACHSRVFRMTPSRNPKES